MGDSIGTTPFAAPGNPDVGSLFNTAAGDDFGDDDDRFSSPGNPDKNFMPDGSVPLLPPFSSPGNPSGVGG